MKVESSYIDEVDYDNENHKLTVTFNNGARWSYYPISQNGYQSLISAESIGSYFHKNIKTNDSVTAEQI